jgi:hypothetical protein
MVTEKPGSFASEYKILTYLPLAVFCTPGASFETVKAVGQTLQQCATPPQSRTRTTQTFTERDSS